MSKLNWNTIWRWIHIVLGMMIMVYFFRIANMSTTWPAWVDELVAKTVIWMVMWSGIAKWQYPRYKKRKNKRIREKKALEAGDTTA